MEVQPIKKYPVTKEKRHSYYMTYKNKHTEFICDVCKKTYKSQQAYSNHIRMNMCYKKVSRNELLQQPITS
jgi:hypothetical protein